MSIVRNGLRVFATSWIVVPLQLLTGILVVRAIGAEGKGILVLLTNSVSLLAVLGQLGVPAAIIYFSRSRTFSERCLLAHATLLTVLVSGAVAGLAFVGRDAFASTFFDGGFVEGWHLVLSVATLPFVMMGGCTSSLLLGGGRSKQYAVVMLSTSLTSVLATLLFVIVLPGGVTGALSANLLAQAVGTLWGTAMIVRGASGEDSRLSARTLGTLVRFGARQYPGILGAQMFKRADSYLLAYFLDARAVGYYSVATLAYDSLLSVPRAFSSLLGGEVAASGARSEAELIARSARNTACVLLLSAIGLFAVGTWLVPIAFGPDFVQAVPPLGILLLASVPVGIVITLQAFFLGVGRPGVNGGLTLVAGLINVALSIWLIPLWGIVGNALATLVGAIASCALHLFWFRMLSHLSMRAAFMPVRDDLRAWRKHLGLAIHRAQYIMLERAERAARP